MARARNIKPGFFKNEDLAECTPWARLCFAGLWTLADREGRLEDRPKRIKGELFPFDTVDVEPLLQELERFKFIYRYEIDGFKAIQILEFAKHQSPHYSESKSVIKPPALLEFIGHDETGTPENSESEGVIKRGAQPPDSLIPDSLIPESKTNPPNPLGEGEPPEPGRRKRPAEPKRTLETFLAECKASGEAPISDYEPLRDYVDRTGLPCEFVTLAWREFKRLHTGGGKNARKLQARWRQTFQNYVERNFLRLWFCQPDGTYALTTPGMQAQAFHDAHREAA